MVRTRILLSEWLNFMESTDLPQSTNGIGTPSCPCAVGLVFHLTGELEVSRLAHLPSTSTAFSRLGDNPAWPDRRLVEALVKVIRWNDRERMTFKEIATRFRRDYPDLIKRYS